MVRNRELLAGAQFEPLAPAELPPEKADSKSSNDLILCTQYAIPRCMARIAQTKNRQLDPKIDFTYKSTTVFKRHQKSNISCFNCTVESTAAKDDEDMEEEIEEEEDDNVPMTFTFTEYSPMCYSHVRTFFGVNTHSFGRVLRTSKWHSTLSPGKSSAHMFFCDKWVIKTMTDSEIEFLRSILHRYYYHVRDNPWTLLPHFVGHYRVKIGMASYNLIVMQNVFVTKSPIHRIYDLKGSTVGRFVSTKESQRTARMLKDLDLNSPIRLGAERKKILMRQLVKDTDFLKKCMIIDYSLLVGIHEVNEGDYMDDPPTMDAEISTKEDPAAVGTSGIPASGKPFQRPTDPSNPRVIPPVVHGNFPMVEKDGGMRSTVDAEFPNEVYFAGIIDILQQYSPRKRLEHFFFGLVHDREKISCVCPSDYADRFLSFISSITV